jgi:hypothetical protein
MSSHEKEATGPTASHVGGLATTQDVERIEAPVTWKAYLICAFASFGGIFFGYDSGYINGVLSAPLFINAVEYVGAKEVSESHQSLIVSILSCGTFFGALIAGDLADFIGRKWTVIIGCLIYIIGCVIQTVTGLGDALGAIVAGRLIAGIGVGFESAIVILYMSEIVSQAAALPFGRRANLDAAVPSQGSRRPGGRLPVLHHHWSHACVVRHLRHQEPCRHGPIPHPHRHPVRLGHHSWRRSPLPARLSALLRQEGQPPGGYQCPLAPPWPAQGLRVHSGRTR